MKREELTKTLKKTLGFHGLYKKNSDLFAVLSSMSCSNARRYSTCGVFSLYLHYVKL